MSLAHILPIVSDQVRYNFYVPPVLFNNQNAPQIGSFPIPSTPVTPFPGVVKYLPPIAQLKHQNLTVHHLVLFFPSPILMQRRCLLSTEKISTKVILLVFSLAPILPPMWRSGAQKFVDACLRSLKYLLSVVQSFSSDLTASFSLPT
jgi:hypothetical protein